MINAKKMYYSLLTDERITTLVPKTNIFSSYPNDVKIFPCIAFVDNDQSDAEYFDNKSGADSCSVQIHVFTKKLKGTSTTSEIGIVIADVMHENLWHCSLNRETHDPRPDVEHRVMNFSKSIFIN